MWRSSGKGQKAELSCGRRVVFFFFARFFLSLCLLFLDKAGFPKEAAVFYTFIYWLMDSEECFPDLYILFPK